ncbi:MAG: AzlC family ABC transporter permease [Ruminococcaceae bacterium]|nr:AzlC family ABC transporter permease [Oscillospiraceae bacterium]
MLEINSFRKGLRDGIPICLGYVSVAFAFGILATSQGLSVLEAVLISALNVTSAGQLAAVPIIAMGGGFFELALTQLVINMRYALMSVSLSQRMGKSISLADRFAISFVNTDEVFAVAMSSGLQVGRKYMYGLILTPFFGWTTGTLVGALAGNILPGVIVSALGIALYAMFIAIVIPAARGDKKVALCSLLAIGLSCLLYFTPVLRDIPSGFAIIISAVLASLVFAILAPIPDEEESDEQGQKIIDTAEENLSSVREEERKNA